jgi:UDP-N-acetylenolpyruvoylglucosamine reductase
VVNCIEFLERQQTAAEIESTQTYREATQIHDETAQSHGKPTQTHAQEPGSFGWFRVGAGYPFNQLGASLSREGWSGLEFAAGIPGTVGGAVFMNAGADGQNTVGRRAHEEFLAPGLWV